MEINTFKIGDRVKVIDKDGFSYDRDLCNKVGTIINIFNGTSVGVRFDKKFFSGHSCDGRCPNGYGRNGSISSLKLLKKNKRKLHLVNIKRVKNMFDKKNVKAVIQLRTEEEYSSLILFLDKHGIKWGSGAIPSKVYVWNAYKQETAMVIEREHIGYANYRYFYSRRKGEYSGYEFFTFKQFMDKYKESISFEDYAKECGYI